MAIRISRSRTNYRRGSYSVEPKTLYQSDSSTESRMKTCYTRQLYSQFANRRDDSMWIRVLTLLLLIPTISLGDEKPDMVFLMIGQSNMAGRAAMEPQDKTPFKGVQLLNAESKWEQAVNPLNRYSALRKDISMQRIGPSAGFGTAIQAHFKDSSIGLIVNARGGSSVNQWQPGMPLMATSLKRWREVGSPQLSAVIWHQGESDAEDPEYLKKLSVVVNEIRSKVGQPDLLFIAGEVYGDRPVNDKIRAIGEHIPHTGFVSVKDLTVFDKVHFDRKSILELGRRYAQKYIELTTKN
ncbi:MAG: acetylxylan esterase [Rhodopirellula sp.]|nr:acetylxylan esterase [Rhodopirellula sp.]HCA49237.1 sialate O-acetylesterase [Planctomycetaceae bacterium]